MLEALEYTAIALAPVFLGAIAFLIITVIVERLTNPYRVFRKRGQKVFRKRS